MQDKYTQKINTITVHFSEGEDLDKWQPIAEPLDLQPETFADKFRRSILDQTKDYPDPVPVISINQGGAIIPFLTLKSLSLWQGKQKSKKTTALALAIAAFLDGGEFIENIGFVGMQGGTVLFFDNEQGESYAARTMKLILKLANMETNDRLIYCDLREFSPTERKKVIEAGIDCTPNVRLVIVDGFVDLMVDFMDAGEGHLTITDMLKLCSKYNIHVAGVLHQNKGDKNSRAHIGSIASQKCEIEITTEVDPKDRAQSIVSCMNSRGLPFEPFAIRWDNGCLPCVNQDWSEAGEFGPRANKTFETAKGIVDGIFQPKARLTYSQSIQAITKTVLKSESTVKRNLKDWLSWGLIAKDADGNYKNATV